MTKSNTFWKGIIKSLEEKEAIGPALELVCQNHPATKTLVCRKADFDKVPEGGCNLPCISRLPCGHACYLKCHIRKHETVTCLKMCEITCELKHNCKKKCHYGKDCDPCLIKVEKKIDKCGHILRLHCYIDQNKINCPTIVKRTLNCKHTKEMECHVDPNSIVCKTVVEKTLKCGHAKTMQCFEPADLAECYTLVKKALDCGHTKKLRCCIDPKTIKCKVNVEKLLKCGHTKNMECFEDADKSTCQVIVEKVFQCGHEKDMECHVDPSQVDCNVLVERKLKCNHSLMFKCHVEPESIICGKPCERILECGHTCEQKCGRICTEHRCTKKVTSILDCKHELSLPCWKMENISINSLLQHCQEKCKFKLKCGHLCRGTCGSCQQGRFHQLCSLVCNRKLPCGHTCKALCSRECPPCKEKCENRCDFHAQCQHRCGDPCKGCREKCQVRCNHAWCNRWCCEFPCHPLCRRACRRKLKCGHQCIGLCGQPCPTECRKCDKDILKEHGFGQESDQQSRFVKLQGCGHVFEVTGLRKWFREKLLWTTGECRPFKLVGCPRCPQVTRVCRPLNELVQLNVSGWELIKRELNGTKEENQTMRRIIHSSVRSLMTKVSIADTVQLEKHLAGVQSKLGLCYVENVAKLCGHCGTLRQRVKTILRSVDERPLATVFRNDDLSKADEEKFNIFALFRRLRRNAEENSSIHEDNSTNDSKLISYRDHLRKVENRLEELTTMTRDSGIFTLINQRLVDIRQEIHRMTYAVEILEYMEIYCSGISKNFELLEIGLKLVDSLFELRPFNGDPRAEFEGKVFKLNLKLIRDGKAKIKLTESAIELQTLSFGKGNWWKCPKDHVFCKPINELCGQCPKC